MRSSGDITQRIVVIPYQRFWTSYLSQLQESLSCVWDILLKKSKIKGDLDLHGSQPRFARMLAS
jgi:hypothetical protein